MANGEELFTNSREKKSRKLSSSPAKGKAPDIQISSEQMIRLPGRSSWLTDD